MLGATISNTVVREHSHGKKRYLGKDQREAREGRSPVDIWEEDILGRGNPQNKGPEAGHCQAVSRDSKAEKAVSECITGRHPVPGREELL